MPAIPIPQPISVAPFDPGPAGPTYTDIYNETVGKLSADFDSLDPALSTMLDISAALDAEQVADEGGGDFGSLSTGVTGFDPTSLDSNVAAYVATGATGQAHIDALSGAAPPVLRQLPMDPTFDGGIGAPPTQITINLGPVKVGSAPISIPLGTQTLTVQTQTYSGLQAAWLADGNVEFFQIVNSYWQNGSDTIEKDSYALLCTPSKVGTFFVEVDVTQDAQPRNTIMTVNLTVTP